MRILVARHGNTFAPGETPVWIGRADDPPLVGEGIAQARRLGRALRASGAVPAIVRCGALRRTRTYAEIVLEELGLEAKPLLDPWLDEIDYGAWAGLTRQQVTALPANAAALARWDAEGVWPEGLGWTPGEAELRRALAGLLEELVRACPREETALVVSSSAVIRTLGRLAANDPVPPPAGAFKMRTGHIGAIETGANSFRVVFWDLDPEALPG